MKKFIIVALSTLFIGSPINLLAKSGFDLVPSNILGFMSFDVRQSSDSFLGFMKKGEGPLKEIKDLVVELLKSQGKEAPAELAGENPFKTMAENYEKKQAESQAKFEKMHIFFLPGFVKKEEKDKAMLVLMEGEFNVAKMKEFAKKESPELEFKDTTVKDLKVIEVTGVQKAAAKQREAQMKMLNNPVKVQVKDDEIPDEVWAVEVDKGYLVGAKSAMQSLLEKPAEKNFSANGQFKESSEKWSSRKPFFSFAGSAPAEEQKSDVSYIEGGMDGASLDILLTTKTPEAAKGMASEGMMKMAQAQGMVQMFGAQLAQKEPALQKTVDGITEFLKGIAITEEKGKVNFKMKNIGLDGFANLIAGGLKAAKSFAAAAAQGGAPGAMGPGDGGNGGFVPVPPVDDEEEKINEEEKGNEKEGK